jgi:hypothetical protein
MHVLPGLHYEVLQEMNWRQICRWRSSAVGVFKRARGVEQ